jgi:hypothetical protein
VYKLSFIPSSSHFNANRSHNDLSSSIVLANIEERLLSSPSHRSSSIAGRRLIVIDPAQYGSCEDKIPALLTSLQIYTILYLRGRFSSLEKAVVKTSDVVNGRSILAPSAQPTLLM